MAKTNNNLNRHGTVLVERSDERLAAVEEAKRTGQEFESVGTRGSDIVDRDAVVAATREVSTEQFGSNDTNLPDYLAALKRGVDDEPELNRRKAAEHSEMSNEVVRTQQEAAVSDAEKLRQDPKYFVKRIAELNTKLTQQYSDTMNQFVQQRARDQEGREREIARVRAESVNDPNPATSLGKIAQENPPDISESSTRREFETKDRIIYGEESYKAQAQARRSVTNDAESENRAQDSELTAEPQRNEKPTRKQKPRSSEKTEEQQQNENEQDTKE